MGLWLFIHNALYKLRLWGYSYSVLYKKYRAWTPEDQQRKPLSSGFFMRKISVDIMLG